MLATGSVDKTVILRDIRDPTPHPLGAPLPGHTDLVSAIAFRPDGRELVTTSYDGELVLWKTAPAVQPLDNRKGVVRRSVSVRPDGRTLAMLAELVLLLADNVAVLLAGLVLITGGFFIAHAAAAATTGSAAHPNYRSQASAVYNTCFYLGSGLGGWLLGLAFDHAGWPVLTLFAAALLLAAAALPTATLLRVRMTEGRTHGCH